MATKTQIDNNYAQMALHVYDNPPQNIGNWHASRFVNDPNTGFAACVYENSVVIAFRGMDDINDVIRG